MSRTFNDDLQFNNLNFSNSRVDAGDYESCRFVNCDLSGADLSDSAFIDCEFSGCNLSLARLIQTSFRNTRFTQCRMLGLRFEDCNGFMISFTFSECMVELCSFNGLTLKNCIFKNSRIIETDFTGTDLSGALFHNCDLDRSIFFRTNLESADFKDSVNYLIDPENNKIKRARFSISGITGLLNKYDIDIV
jgi:uncharacterized protein YjbI with pentapeptide repeats